MKTLLHELEKNYKPFKSPRYQYSFQQYQKKFTDEKWIKYFINCALYEHEWKTEFEFDVSFTTNDRSINIKTVSRTSDPEEKWRSYPTLQEVEDMFEKMRVAYWKGYYELYL
jgi:hypothetical protein